MPLVLNLASENPALPAPNSRLEVLERLTIGRGPKNNLVLPDPSRHISTDHCVIQIDGRSGGYTITDVSRNGTFVNGKTERLPRGVAVPLREGTTLHLGDYALTVAAIVQPKVGVPTPIREEPDYGDPFAMPESKPQDRPRVSTPVGWQPERAPTPEILELPTPPPARKIPMDWKPGVGGRTPREAVPPVPVPLPIPPIPQPVYEPPPPPAPHQFRAEPVLAPPTPLSQNDSGAVAAFLQAAGLGGLPLSEGEKAVLLRVAGETFGLLVKGLMEILGARMSTKQEFRIERTQIGAVRNNPLKTATSLPEALELLLLQRSDGYLPAKDSVNQAIDDIKSHQLAVLAGMQAALATLMQGFDPAKLEQRLQQPSIIDDLMPGGRKAKYWELFKTHYKEIAAELEDDFQKAFGAAFARAYKDQVDRF